MPINYIRIEGGLVEVKCEFDNQWNLLKGQDTRQYIGALDFVLKAFIEENKKAEPNINIIINKIKSEKQRVNK